MKYSLLTLSLLAFLFAFSTELFAVNIVVNQSDDAGDGTVCNAANCTLRGAVYAANNLSSNDTITFAAGITNITLNNEIQIFNNGALFIIGAGANVLTIDGGAGTNRIFFVNSALVIIQGVTLSGGNGDGAAVFGDYPNGGGVYSVYLESIVVQNNAGDNSQFGAVYLRGNAGHRIFNSTFSANTGFRDCAAIRTDDASLTVMNTTVSGNSTTSGGFGTGAICLVGNAGFTFRNTTISGNSAGSVDAGGGGGIYIAGTVTIDLGNTIIAGNSAAKGPDLFMLNNSSTLISSGGNLIGDNSGSAANPNTTAFPAGNPNANGDKVGTANNPINPLLAPFANNGGTTLTRALLFGSPALDAGINSLATQAFDQRGTGFARIRDGNNDGTATVDIGAFEAQMAPPAARVSISGRVIVGRRGLYSARVTMIKANGETRTTLSNPFGYYRFYEVEAGQSYVFSVSSKRYQFTPRTVSVMGNLEELNFTAGQ